MPSSLEILILSKKTLNNTVMKQNSIVLIEAVILLAIVIDQHQEYASALWHPSIHIFLETKIKICKNLVTFSLNYQCFASSLFWETCKTSAFCESACFYWSLLLCEVQEYFGKCLNMFF